MRALWSLAGLVLLLAGMPAALVVEVGWPLPRQWPDGEQLQRWATQSRPSPAVVADVVACGLWLVWAWLAYLVGAEVLARLTRIRLPRLRLPTPIQAVASGMVGAVVLGATGTRGPSTATPPAGAATAVTALDGPGAQSPAERPGAGTGMVELPGGGSVHMDTADAVDVAVGLLWLRRRRRYRPRRVSGAARADPDLTGPAPGVAALVRAAGRRVDGDDESPTPAAPVPVGAGGGATLGQHGGHRLRPHELPAGGVGLVGPGAADAARAILATLVLAGEVGHHDGPARLLTTRTDLRHLLGRETDPGIGGLRVTDSIDAALAELDRWLLGVASPDSDHPVGDTTPAGTAPGRPPPGRADLRRAPLVLLTAAPDGPHTDRLAVTLRLAAGLGVRGVLLGGWRHGVTWHIDTDGTARTPGGDPPIRLGVLTAEVTGEILTLVDQYTTDPPDPPADVLPTSMTGPDPSPDPDPDSGPDADTGPTTGAMMAGAVPDPATVAVGSRPLLLRLRLLGRPAVWRPGPAADAVPIQRSAAVEILTFLAVHRGGATSRQIIAAVWPDVRPSPALRRLHTTLSALRAALREAGGTDVVERVGEAYRLNPHQIDVDLWRLGDAVDRAAGCLDRAGRGRALREVTDVYSGALAAGLRRPWLDPYREAARRHAVDAHLELAAAAHDPQQALEWLRAAVGHDPDNEELHRILMRHHAAAGNPGGVRQTLRALTDHLDSYGQQPDEQTRHLADQLLSVGDTR